MAQAPGVVAAGISDSSGFGIYVSLDGGPAREIHRSSESVRIGSAGEGGFLLGGLSADGALLCVEHAEHGDLIHPALRVLDPRTGATLGEQLDEGLSLEARCWSPVPGDQRLAIEHERDGDERPAIWDLATGERQDLELDAEGPVFVSDWWPDGQALLLINRREGRDRLLRYDVPTGEHTWCSISRVSSGRLASDPTGRSGCSTSSVTADGAWSTIRAPRCSGFEAAKRPPGSRTSPGTSRTRTDNRCTASSSRPRAPMARSRS